MTVCAQCGAENRDEARFCDSCGGGLATVPADVREERKVVTVLFADLVGFTGRAEQMDPEDVRALLSPYYAHVRAELERYGGTVEKFIGDAVMALFGAPVAHEDDPERAVRAALTIRDWAREQGDELHLRVAVTTGEALVALGARPIEGEGMASGDVVNTAARLQAAAPVDGILVDESTYRATSQAIEYEPAEPVSAKGKTERVPAWEAVEARSRFGVDTVQAPRSPLIGRDREVSVLADALARAREQSAPQLVTLVGVPGIGKSRLVYELFQVVDNDPELIVWRQGRSLPYGEGVSFWALGEIVKAHAGILEGDPPAEAEQKLARIVAATVEEDTEWVNRHLRLLLGLGTEQELQGDYRSEAFAAWRRFFESIAVTGPLVLVFEDLHWADEGLLDFVDHLVDWATGVPILVVCSARPELLTRRPGWGGGKPNALTLSLSPLDDQQTARLVAALLERSVLPAETQATLLQRAGGNPLYAEEFVRMMADRDLVGGNDDLPLPESIQGIVSARLDALGEDEKTLLQDAAVVGKVFWLGTVSRIGGREARSAEDWLHRLERKEFVRRQQRSSVADETEYAFRHVLVRDVAYGQIPRALRADKHRLAAEWIEGLGRPEDHAEMVAHHYLTALELSRAAGAETDEMAERARYVLRDAGERALSLGSYPAAQRFYEAALDLWPLDAEGRPRLLFKYASIVSRIEFGRGHGLLEEARDGLLEAGDLDAAAEAEVKVADAYWLRGERDRGFEALDRARALVEERPTTLSKANVFANVSRFQMLSGQSEAAISSGRVALAMVEELGGNEELQAHVLNNVGSARVFTGDLDGISDLERSIEIATAINSAESVRSLGNLASILTELGDLERRNDVAARGLLEAERFGLDDHALWLRAEETSRFYWDGDWAKARQLLDELIGDFEKRQYWMEPVCRWVRGRIRLAEGDTAGAQQDARGSLERARTMKDPQVLWPALAFGARVALTTGDKPWARELAREVLAGWQERANSTVGAGDWASDATIVLVELGLGHKFVEAASPAPSSSLWIRAACSYAAGDFGAAADIYATIGSRPDEAYARLRSAEFLVREGRRAEADAELQRALAFWRAVGATAYVREGEALRAASA